MGTIGYYRSIVEAVFVQKSTIGALGRLCWYSRVLYEHSGDCVGTAKYYRSTGEAWLVQKSTKALGRLCRYSRVL